MPIIAASFCPHPPLLIPAVAAGAAAELEDLRVACLASIQAVTTDCDEVVIVGAGPDARTFDTPAAGSMIGFGVPDSQFVTALGEGEEFGFSGLGPQLPLSLTVGAWLLRLAGWGGAQRAVSLGVDDVPALSGGARRVALLVMGDGAPSRSLAAPGYLDDRAAAYDASVARALASGEPNLLAGLDVDLARSLGVAGWPAWRVAASSLGGRRWTADLLYDAAPYGVGYFVATWRLAT